jgi:hypothetical protein
MIIGPTVWVPGLGPNSGFDFARLSFKPAHDCHGQVKLRGKGSRLVLGRATRAHYRSKVGILQDRIERFSKTFSLCFFYCKFWEEGISCTTISTASPDQALF